MAAGLELEKMADDPERPSRANSHHAQYAFVSISQGVISLARLTVTDQQIAQVKQLLAGAGSLQIEENSMDLHATAVIQPLCPIR